MTAFEANAWEVASHLVNLSVAFALAIPIGWDRERDARSAGIRTFPLVSIAACGFVLVAIRVLGADSAGQARIIEGLATGVGFIGGTTGTGRPSSPRVRAARERASPVRRHPTSSSRSRSSRKPTKNMAVTQGRSSVS